MAIPLSEGMLDVGAGHHVYFAEYGCPDGPAAVVLHGGPGSRCHISMLEWFDLSRQRVVLFDQRGCGSSTPKGELANNTTQDLVSDIEKLRQALGIHTWLVVGGSWGAMLALAYAGTHPSAVKALVLRGMFLPGTQQLDWFFHALQSLVPTAWAGLVEDMGGSESQSVLSSLASRLRHGSDTEQRDAARRWAQYEDAVMDAMTGKTHNGSESKPEPEPDLLPGQLEKYRLQAHYLTQSCFLDEPELFKLVRGIVAPTILVHGTHDWICPPLNVYRLMVHMPDAQIRWVASGTHTTSDPQVRAALRDAIRDIQPDLGTDFAIDAPAYKR
jgi:proline iminopeptidase